MPRPSRFNAHAHWTGQAFGGSNANLFSFLYSDGTAKALDSFLLLFGLRGLPLLFYSFYPIQEVYINNVQRCWLDQVLY